MSEMHKGLPMHHFETKLAFAKWLAKHHAQPEAVWLKLAKKASGVKSISYEEAREVALMYGWIDGLKNALDETFFVLRFCARRPRSKWSKINRGIVEELIAKKAMKPSGMREVVLAKSDGRWEAAYEAQSTMTVPPDFQKALDRNRKAKAFFAKVSRANRYAILYRIADAKRADTRARRIDKYVDMLARGETIH